jgi:hypothetical protein
MYEFPSKNREKITFQLIFDCVTRLSKFSIVHQVPVPTKDKHFFLSQRSIFWSINNLSVPTQISRVVPIYIISHFFLYLILVFSVYVFPCSFPLPSLLSFSVFCQISLFLFGYMLSTPRPMVQGIIICPWNFFMRCIGTVSPEIA